MEWIEIILTPIGGDGAALLIVGALGQKLIDLWMARALKKYEAGLEQRTETLKTELSIYAHEQTIGLIRLEEKRSEAIQDIYGLVMKWHKLLIELTQPDDWPGLLPELKLRRHFNVAQNFLKGSDALSIKIRNTAILFSEENYQKLAKFGMAATDLSNSFYGATLGRSICQRTQTMSSYSKRLNGRRLLFARLHIARTSRACASSWYRSSGSS